MTTKTSFVWDIPPSVLASQVLGYRKRVLLAVLAVGRLFAARIESYAKKNARWTDRTSLARQGLTARVIKTATGVIIVLYHTMSYGKWLEIANAGRFAIILEALEVHYAPLMVALAALVKR